MIQKKEAWLWTSGFCGIFLAVAQQESITKAAELALSPQELATIDAILAAV